MADESAVGAGKRKSLPRAKKVKAAGKPALHYTVSMADPASHTFQVEIKLSGVGDCVLAFPAWTPGSYKIREFGKNVSNFSVRGAKFEMLDKQRYRISGAGTVSFDYYADELSVRTPHLDDTHGFFLGTNLLPYLENSNGRQVKAEYSVTVKPFKGWKVATSLPGKGNTFHTDDYDVLGDTPFEIGTHSVKSFTVRGVKHDVAFYGYGNHDVERIMRDTKKLVEVQAKNFGGLPYDYYLFIHHITPDSGGGLEHLNSCVCGWPSWKFKKEEDYQRFIRLVSHEFFHVWNVKRIRPAILGPFDYSKEQHTKALWIMEGMTQYYERLWCARAGVCDAQTVLDSYAETIDREDNRPGRKVMSLEDSSWLAWTKLYLADENFLNTGVSYYSRGAQVGLLLDAKIRLATDGKHSLDDVMKLAHRRWGWPKPGFKDGEWEALCEEVAGIELTALWRDHVRGTREMKYDEVLDCYGLELKRDKKGTEPWLGVTVTDKSGSLQVTSVHADGPARKAGLQPRDELLALNGHKLSGKAFEERLAELSPGKSCTLTLFRRERLVTADVKVVAQPAGKLKLTPLKKQTSQQKQNFRRWMGKR